MYATRGPTARRWPRSAMSPTSTITVPCCFFFEPAISAMSVDLPTPSGPTMPTMMPLVISIEMLSSATTLPYRCVTSLTETTGFPPTPADDSRGVDDAVDEISKVAALIGLRLAERVGLRSQHEVLQPRRPDGRFFHFDVANAPDTRLDGLDVLLGDGSGHLDLDPEHQLFAFAARLDLLRSELRFRGHEADKSGDCAVGIPVNGDPSFGAELRLGGIFRREEYLHVDVFQVHQRQCFSAGR